MTHGDFKRTNLLVNDNLDIQGIIDWDLSKDKGLPLTDIVLMASYEIGLRDDLLLENAIEAVAFQKEIFVRPFFEVYRSLVKIDFTPQDLRLAGLMCLVYRFRDHVSTLQYENKVWVRNHVAPIIQRALSGTVISLEYV